jgi:hypothetical protein
MTPAPFMLLGCPRSGTNYLSALLKAHPAVELQIEPFSMHVQAFMDSEFSGVVETDTVFRCSCGRCISCDLRTWLRSGSHRGFKETTVFDRLGQMASWLPELRVVFLGRDPRDIVESYLSGSLHTRWKIATRFQCHPDPTIRSLAASAPNELETQAELCTVLTTRRLRKWIELGSHFESLAIRYSELIRSPHGSLEQILKFLGLSTTAECGRAIDDYASRSAEDLYSPFKAPNAQHFNIDWPTHERSWREFAHLW